MWQLPIAEFKNSDAYAPDIYLLVIYAKYAEKEDIF
jgi:hypothetical protein